MFVIAGPCVIEDEALTLSIAHRLNEISEELHFRLIFKASFDKANRTSVDSYRGPGLEVGLDILRRVGETTGLGVTTDIHEPWQAEAVGYECSIVQIPAFLCRQTDLLRAAAETGKAVLVKKGQQMAPSDMGSVIEKLAYYGCEDIMLCERGTFFGYGQLVNDMRAIAQMKSFGASVVFDATHSVQEPGGLGSATGGDRRMVEPLARGALAVGVDGLFFEVHPDPDKAPCDGQTMLPLDEFPAVMQRLMKIEQAVSLLEE